jgi:hypothetical protein
MISQHKFLILVNDFELCLCGNDRTVVWIMTGFSLALVTMEVGFRLAKAQTRKVSITRPIAMEQEIEV